MRWPDALAAAAVAKWERSSGFGPGPVSRPVRLNLSERDFPRAWGTGGHAMREVIIAAALDLERRGLAEVRRSGRGSFAAPRAVLLQPAAVEEAYAAMCGPTLRSHIRVLLKTIGGMPRPSTDWARELLDRAAIDLSEGRTSLLGRNAHEPATYDEIIDALRVVVRLSERAPFEERSLSGALFGNTKRLREIRPRVRQILLMADPRWSGLPAAPDDRTLFGHYGEAFKPPFISVALGVEADGLAAFNHFRPYAVLAPEVLLRAADAYRRIGVAPLITTVENESAFIRYLEEPGVWGRIESLEEVVIYTGGYASDGIRAFVRALVSAPGQLRHWGDTDAEGVRIGLIMAEAAGGGSLFRSQAEWVRSAPQRLGQPIDEQHRAELKALLADDRLDLCDGVRELIGATLEVGVWLEQEVFYATAPEDYRYTGPGGDHLRSAVTRSLSRSFPLPGTFEGHER